LSADGYAQPGFYAYIDADRVNTRLNGEFDNCRLYSYLFLSRKVNADEIENLQERLFAGIVLGCSDEAQGDRILVVDTSNEIAERVGTLDLFGWHNYVRGTKRAENSDTEAPLTLTVSHNFGAAVDKWNLQKAWPPFD
jgi:hypothetical protein